MPSRRCRCFFCRLQMIHNIATEMLYALRPPRLYCYAMPMPRRFSLLATPACALTAFEGAFTPLICAAYSHCCCYAISSPLFFAYARSACYKRAGSVCCLAADYYVHTFMLLRGEDIFSDERSCRFEARFMLIMRGAHARRALLHAAAFLLYR